MGISLPFFAEYLLILTDPRLQRSGTFLHWFVVVVLPILEDLFTNERLFFESTRVNFPKMRVSVKK